MLCGQVGLWFHEGRRELHFRRPVREFRPSLRRRRQRGLRPGRAAGRSASSLPSLEGPRGSSRCGLKFHGRAHRLPDLQRRVRELESETREAEEPNFQSGSLFSLALESGAASADLDGPLLRRQSRRKHRANSLI